MSDYKSGNLKRTLEYIIDKYGIEKEYNLFNTDCSNLSDSCNPSAFAGSCLL